MRNARRNQLLLWSFAVLGLILTATITYVLFLAFPDRPLRPALLAGAMAVFWGWWVWTTISQRRRLQEVERELRQAGVPVPDEEPIPVRLAESRESLVVSLIMLLLMAAVAVAYFGGWIR